MPVSSRLRAILDRDLKLAGIPKRDDRGRTVDVHALRHTFGTHLSKGGVAPRTAQAALRHSSIDLTMNVYTDPRLLDVHGALDALPVLALKGIESPTPNSHPSAAADAPSERKSAPSLLAPMLAPNLRKRRHLLSIVDPMGGRRERHEQPTPRVVTPDTVNGKGSLSTGDNDPQQSGRLDLNQRPLRGRTQRACAANPTKPRCCGTRCASLHQCLHPFSVDREDRPSRGAGSRTGCHALG